MRGKGEGAIYRVPKDRKQPLKYWVGTIELPPRDGTRRKITRRRKDKAALLSEMDDLRKQLKERGDLPTKGQTVEQWFTYWIAMTKKEVRPNTWDGYMRAVKNHIVPTIGTVKLEKVTAAHVRRVHDAITGKGLSSTTALLAHRVMSASFKAAVREGRMHRNPAELTNAPRKAVAMQEAFDVDEALKVLAHVSRDPLMGACWATALFIGARRGETIGLELDRLDFEADHIDLSWQLQRIPLTATTGRPDVPADFEYRHLSGGLYLTRPKSSAGMRIIPLFEPLRSILRRHVEAMPPNPYGLVFAIDGAPIDPDRHTAQWRNVLEATGIEKNVVLHGLRHTAVDLLFMAGVPEDLIQEIVGQSTRATTRSYKTKGATSRARLDAALRDYSALFTRPDDARSSTPEAIES